MLSMSANYKNLRIQHKLRQCALWGEMPVFTVFFSILFIKQFLSICSANSELQQCITHASENFRAYKVS